jgi:hypothetical protein
LVLNQVDLVPPLGRAELIDLLMVLESAGLITIRGKSTKKIRMDVSSMDVVKGVQDIQKLHIIAESDNLAVQ